MDLSLELQGFIRRQIGHLVFAHLRILLFDVVVNGFIELLVGHLIQLVFSQVPDIHVQRIQRNGLQPFFVFDYSLNRDVRSLPLSFVIIEYRLQLSIQSELFWDQDFISVMDYTIL